VAKAGGDLDTTLGAKPLRLFCKVMKAQLRAASPRDLSDTAWALGTLSVDDLPKFVLALAKAGRKR
jgi:hypothetical protein